MIMEMICINYFQRIEIPDDQHGNNSNACSTDRHQIYTYVRHRKHKNGQWWQKLVLLNVTCDKTDINILNHQVNASEILSRQPQTPIITTI